jgi:hypothetical protein
LKRLAKFKPPLRGAIGSLLATRLTAALTAATALAFAAAFTAGFAFAATIGNDAEGNIKRVQQVHRSTSLKNHINDIRTTATATAATAFATAFAATFTTATTFSTACATHSCFSLQSKLRTRHAVFVLTDP